VKKQRERERERERANEFTELTDQTPAEVYQDRERQSKREQSSSSPAAAAAAMATSDRTLPCVQLSAVSLAISIRQLTSLVMLRVNRFHKKIAPYKLWHYECGKRIPIILHTLLLPLDIKFARLVNLVQRHVSDKL